MINLAEEVIEGHGGLARWQATESVSLGLWAGGIAFRTKGHTRTLHDVTATVAIGHPCVSLAGRHPYPWQFRFGERPGRSTAWRGRWSLDQIADFTAGALWTHINSPLLAFLDGVTVEVPHPRRHHQTRALRLTPPAGVGVHGPHHTLLIDEHGLIQSHHYVATAFGRWALASQSVDDNHPFDGLLIGARRRVTPRLSPTRGAPGPTLVSIRLRPPPGLGLNPRRTTDTHRAHGAANMRARAPGQTSCRRPSLIEFLRPCRRSAGC